MAFRRDHWIKLMPICQKEFVNDTIRYSVCEHKKLKNALVQLAFELKHLDEHNECETTLLIFDTGFKSFEQYLDLVDLANGFIEQEGYSGVYQIASFHPDYLFEGEESSDTSHYTNRSPYPMLHLIREESMERVLKSYKSPEQIPIDNIANARRKGAAFFEAYLK